MFWSGISNCFHGNFCIRKILQKKMPDLHEDPITWNMWRQRAESTFKIKPQRPLEKSRPDSRLSVQHPWINLQDQASTALGEIKKPDSRSGVHRPWIKTSSRWKLWKNHKTRSKIKPRRPLDQTSTLRDFKDASSTRDKHMYTTRFEVGAFVDNEISVNKMLTDGQNVNAHVLHKLYT